MAKPAEVSCFWGRITLDVDDPSKAEMCSTELTPDEARTLATDLLNAAREAEEKTS